MRSTKSKNRTGQLPIQVEAVTSENVFQENSTSELSNAASDFLNVKQSLTNMFGSNSLSSVEEELSENLKADIGHDIGSGQRLPLDITYQLGTITSILSFLNTFPNLLTDSLLKECPEFVQIKEMINKINYDHTFQVFFRGFQNWIYQDDDYETASIDYMSSISATYKEVIDVLRVCNKVHSSLNTKKGAGDE